MKNTEKKAAPQPQKKILPPNKKANPLSTKADTKKVANKVILLGCTGLIGSALCKLLASKGYHQTLVVKKSQPAKDIQTLQNLKIVTTKNNFSSKNLQKIIAGNQVVINLIGENIAAGRWSTSKKERILQSRINTTATIVKAINTLKTPPKLLINASAVGYYGASTQKNINENSNAGEDFMANVCKQWEKTALQANKKTRVVLLRTGVVLSRKGGAFAQLLPHFRAGLGGSVGSGQQGFPWVHINDATAIIAFAIENKNMKGAINITAPHPVTFVYFAKALAKALKRPCLFTKPAWLIKILLGDEKSSLILTGNFAKPKKIIATKYTFFHSKIETAITDLLKKKH